MKTTYKQYNAAVQELGERKMSFMITTDAVDRDGDTVDPKGWDLKSFQGNPVVLWAHDYSLPPIGKAVNVEMTKNGLKADVEFLPKGMNQFADMIHDMVKGGFLNATSVGFKGIDFEQSKERKYGYDFAKQELLEFSIVPVPANPEALALRGVKKDQVQKYAKALRHWTKAILGDDAPKLDAEQFDNLADAIAKAMQDEPKKDTPEPQTLDYAAIAAEVAKILKPEPAAPTKEISTDVLDIKEEDSEKIEWGNFELPEPAAPAFEFDAETVSKMLMADLKECMREMVVAQTQAAINHMTGRLD